MFSNKIIMKHNAEKWNNFKNKVSLKTFPL